MSIVISGTTGIDAGSLPVSNCGNTEVEGNLNLSGVGTRITGDFSNATASNRVAFQTSTLNEKSSMAIIPNGTGVSSNYVVYNSSDMSNASNGYLYCDSSVVGLTSGKTGTGTYLPLVIQTGGSERMRIDTAGNVAIGVTPSAWGSSWKSLDLLSSSITSYTTLTDPYTIISNNAYISGNSSTLSSVYKNNGSANSYNQGGGAHIWRTAPSGTAGNPITWNTAMTLDANGRLLVGSNGLNPIQGVTIRNESTIGVVDTGHASGTASGNQYSGYYYNGTLIGSIIQSGTTAVAYNTTSDYRLKENIRPADCKRFMDIKFVDYERIDGNHECGVIAHELQEIYPDLVIGEKDATEIRKVELTPAVAEIKDEDGNIISEAVEAIYEEQEFPVYQQVNYIGLIARIGTVVQQQAKLIEELRLEVEILKEAK